MHRKLKVTGHYWPIIAQQNLKLQCWYKKATRVLARISATVRATAFADHSGLGPGWLERKGHGKENAGAAWQLGGA